MKHFSQPSSITPGTAASVAKYFDVLKVKAEPGNSSQILDLSKSSEVDFSGATPDRLWTSIRTDCASNFERNPYA